MYYIISLHHTQKHEKFLTLWRPDNAGYCYSKEQAGVYEIPVPGYHDSDTDMPISVDAADGLFIKANWDNVNRYMIPNCAAVWDPLGVRMTKNGLAKKPAISKALNQS